MAYVALLTDRGVARSKNEDAGCIEVAETALGEVVMAVVCDGVGGLELGELASSTVVERFVRWFECDLRQLVEEAHEESRLRAPAIENAWAGLLNSLNADIHAYGRLEGVRLGTTFTGVLACGGEYLVGHVGDCRAYLVCGGQVTQVTRDQTQRVRRFAPDATGLGRDASAYATVLVQAVGTQGKVSPAFSAGALPADGLFVVCSDGAYRKAGASGVLEKFQGVDRRDEQALGAACRSLVTEDIQRGETDNLTVACFSGRLRCADAPTSVFPG
jgi:serine/threonine protein phosphatase PrpC